MHQQPLPELLAVFSKQEICICIIEKNNSWSHRSVASKPIHLVCLLAIQAPSHALNQIALKHWQVCSLLLGSTLVSA
jgi:hypothetical protein